MKNPWMAALVVLQVLTLVLVGGLFLRADRPRDEFERRELDEQINVLRGAAYQERDIVERLDLLRARLDRLLAAEAVAPGASGAPAVAEPEVEADGEQDRLLLQPDSGPFPDAAAVLEELRAQFQLREKERVEEDPARLRPFDLSLEELTARLLRLGPGALYHVNREVTKNPYEAERDPAFITWLFEHVVPELTGIDPAATFRMARDGLLTITNENPVRLAAAAAMRQIDPQRWVKEYLEVLTLSSERERDVSLRIALLDAFQTEPRPEVVEPCRAFLRDPAQPAALRGKAVEVLAAQESEAVIPTLREVLFEDANPDLRLSALHALYRRLGPGDDRRRLLEDVVNADPARMHEAVRNQARELLADR